MTDERWIKWMEYGHRLGCHQRPDRSFFIKGYQMPVCARCTGCVISVLLGTIGYWVYPFPVWICILMSLVMLIDWGIQRLGIKESTNTRRFITGLIGGFGYSELNWYVLMWVIRFIINLF